MGYRLLFFRAALALLVHKLERLKLKIVEMVENREHFTFDDLLWPDLCPDLNNDRCTSLTFQAVGGGAFFAPLLFFCNNSETRRDSDAKFRIASNEYLAHICAKFQMCTRSGQVTVT